MKCCFRNTDIQSECKISSSLQHKKLTKFSFKLHFFNSCYFENINESEKITGIYNNSIHEN